MDRIAGLDRARKYPAGQDTAQERVALDGGDQHPEGAVFDLGLFEMFDHLVEQRTHGFL